MNNNLAKRFKLYFSIGFLSIVAACGGGSGNAISAIEIFTTNLSSAMASLASTPSGFAGFTNLLDSTYKQDGITNANLVAILTADAAAIPADASFPVVSYSSPVISNCNAANICDLNVIAFNADVDYIATNITLKVLNTGSGYKLVGDQSAS
ncbi:MAG: hypothetical protein WCO34_09800 [Betaproteobacteria bacterium]|jgi:hypothetical protein